MRASKLAWRERLGHIVVGAHLEARTLSPSSTRPVTMITGMFLVSAFLLEASAHLPAVSWDHDVEQHQVGVDLTALPECVRIRSGDD